MIHGHIAQGSGKTDPTATAACFDVKGLSIRKRGHLPGKDMHGVQDHSQPFRVGGATDPGNMDVFRSIQQLSPFFGAEIGDARRPAHPRQDGDSPPLGLIIELQHRLGGIVIVTDTDIWRAGLNRRLGYRLLV